MPPYILPSPPPFAAGAVNAWTFFFVAGAGVVLGALPWTVNAGLKHRNWKPLVLVAAGFLCSLVEPMLDLLGHLRWAHDLQGPAFVNFGINVPYLIPPCYAAFFGLEVYFTYFMLKKGITAKQCFLLVAVSGITDAIMETVGLNLHTYQYYGVQPFTLFKFPYWWGVINGTAMFAGGFLMWYLVPRLKGAMKGFYLLVPITGMTGAYFMCGWPWFLAVNAHIPVWSKWCACVIMFALCALLVRSLAYFAAVAEPKYKWTFFHMFFYRMLPPSGRARMEARIIVSQPVEVGEAVERNGAAGVTPEDVAGRPTSTTGS